jgi:hypothetical protein
MFQPATAFFLCSCCFKKRRALAEKLQIELMPKFYFKLVDSRIVSDHGVHDLPSETDAQIEAIKLARSLREARPELVGRNCSISVANESGKEICKIPIDAI